MNKLGVWIVTFVFSALAVLPAQAQSHKGISFQAVIKLPDGELPTRTGITVNARILSPNNCILREEQFTSVNVTNGYINLNIGTGTTGGNDPGLTLKQLMDNSATISGLTCLNLDGTTNGGVTSFNPASTNGARKFRMSMTIDSTPIVADFNMRAMAYAINSESLDGKTKADFINVNGALSQTNAESIFNRFTKLDAILNNFNAGGTALSANVSGTAANVTGTVAIANGGTGATSAAAAKTNLGLVAIASSGSGSDITTGTVAPARLGSGTADNTTYLRGDGTWATIAAAGGDITDVTAGTGLTGGGTTGAVTLNLSDVGTAGDYYKVTTNAQGRVTAGQAALVAGDIPSLPTSKITTGTFADAMLAGLSIDKLISASTKYFNYKPNNVACADNEVLKYDSTLNASAGGWKCAPDSGVGSETDPSVAAYAKNAPGAGLTVTSNVVSVDSGTTANKIVKLDGTGKLPAVDGSALTNLPTGSSFSGSLSGDVTGTQSATVVGKINGVTASTAVAGDDQKYMKYVHGSGWQPQFIKLSELRNSTGASSAFNVGSCTAAQTLVWSSITDQFSCQAINGIPAANITGLGALATMSAASLTADVSGILPIANGGTGAATTSQAFVFAGPVSGSGAPAFRALASTDLPASASYWSAATGGINYAGGNVGVGTISPIEKFEVVGGIVASGSIGASVPANSSILMASCASGWTDTGTSAGGPSATSCNGSSCRVCQSPASASLVPASSVILMENCPGRWTYIDTPAGPASAGIRTAYSACRSPATASSLPLGSRLIMSTCPAAWNDLGALTGLGGLNADCGGSACHACEVPGNGTFSQLQTSSGTLVLQPTSGNVGIGTNVPAQKLDVAGSASVSGSLTVGTQATRATASTNRGQLASGSTFTKTSAGSTTLDANDGNIQEVVNFLCNNSNTITFSNMRDGGVYTVLLSGAVAHTNKCLFAHSGLTFQISGGNVAPTANRDVLFTFAVIGTTVIYSMSDNLQ